jgi:hypothetical protein
VFGRGEGGGGVLHLPQLWARFPLSVMYTGFPFASSESIMAAAKSAACFVPCAGSPSYQCTPATQHPFGSHPRATDHAPLAVWAATPQRGDRRSQIEAKPGKGAVARSGKRAAHGLHRLSTSIWVMLTWSFQLELTGWAYLTSQRRGDVTSRCRGNVTVPCQVTVP